MKAKRSLGQNFFANRNLAEQISNIVLENNPDLIVEIGPGTGSFTKYLSEGKDLLLIEKDDILSENLRSKFPKTTVLNIDFLDWEMEELIPYSNEKIIFFGSLPYNVSKPIIRKIIRSDYFNSFAYFIIQKEVAEKYIARAPDSNILSLETEIFATSKKLFDISRESFRPKPNVTSSFVSFSAKNSSFDYDIGDFESFLQTIFRHPRKTVKNNLGKMHIKNNDKEIERLLSMRPQHLQLEEVRYLFSNIQ